MITKIEAEWSTTRSFTLHNEANPTKRHISSVTAEVERSADGSNWDSRVMVKLNTDEMEMWFALCERVESRVRLEVTA
jgi:hypothetical protein